MGQRVRFRSDCCGPRPEPRTPPTQTSCTWKGLIGHNTVNTLPPATLDAFADHGSADVAALVEDVDDAYSVLEQLAAVGVNLDAITDKLQTDGVQAFIDAFDGLLGAIEEKRSALV